jgi:hypothetical protein
LEFDVAEWANVLSNGRQRMMGRAVGKVLVGQAPDLRQAWNGPEVRGIRAVAARFRPRQVRPELAHDCGFWTDSML